MKYLPNENRYSRMKYNRCGESGLLLPELSLGLWQNFGTYNSFEEMKKMLFTAFDAGVTHFDLANNYGPVPGSAEENFGKILEDDLSAYRDELIISTKAGYLMWDGPYGNWGSRKYLLSSLDQSLKRMKIDYVDIFYHHRMDPNTPLEETMGALNQAVKSGKALYAGLSNYDGETMKKASAILKRLDCPFVINQNRYSILDRTIEKNGLKQAAKSEKKGIIIFSPLAQGALTNRYLNGVPKDSRAVKDKSFLENHPLTKEKIECLKKLNTIAQGRGQTLAQMSLAWIMKDAEPTSVLIGASSAEQVRENLKAFENTEFSKEELDEIDRVSDGIGY